ncbi:MAG: septum formation inhibitor Maf [Deltaproteobacteria bacterium]|nr:septum formation inhibitor Maf [Deltaproteobacteria bacterium]
MKVPELKPKIILASRSPRRRYLLERAGVRFSVIPSEFDESSISMAPPDDYVRSLATAKAQDIASRYPESWVIGADTVVVAANRVLGKPASTAEARDMLRHLSGRTHQVLTGFCVCRLSETKLFAETARTDVLFKTLTSAEIDWYIQTGEPFDKAGAYAIQGIGTFLVKRIDGSYTNVVGLPVCEVIEILIREKVIGFDEPHPAPAAAQRAVEEAM